MMTLLILACLSGFQEDEIQITEEFKFQYVRLDIAAFDKDGNPVTDLVPSDFVVKENRKKIRLDSFRILDYDKQTSASLDTETLKTIPEPENDLSRKKELLSQYILVLDFESANLMEIRRTISELEQFLDSFEPERRLQIMIYSMQHGEQSEKFHDNIDDVKRVLNNYKKRYLGEIENRTRIGSSATNANSNEVGIFNQKYDANYGKLNRDIDELETKLRQCRTLHAPINPRDRLELDRCLDLELELYLKNQEERAESSIGQLEILVNAFKNIEGMKSILFVSPGFSITPGESGFLLTEFYRHFAKSELDGINARNPADDGLQTQIAKINTSVSTVRRPKSFEDEFRAVINSCTRNRVVFHAFDLFNFQRDRDRLDDLHHQSGKPSKLQVEAHRQYGVEMQEGLARLAEDSGGRFAAGVSLGGPLKSVLNERQYIYVLGYESPPGKEGKFRSIKIKCKRRGIKLRYRKGYIGS